MTERVTKKCARCGHVAKVRPRQRHCHQRRFGKGSYACWGDLSPVVRKRKEAKVVDPMQAYRERVAKQLAATHRQVRIASTKIARLAQRLRKLQVAEAYLLRRTAMTDAELAAEREKRQRAAKAPRPARGIALKGFDA